MRTCRSASRKGWLTPFSKKVVLLIIAAIVLIIIGIDLILFYKNSKPKFSMEPPDAEIKLLGIEPDCSGTIFDVNGRKLFEDIIIDPTYSPRSKETVKRTFIFAVTDSAKQIFSPTIRVSKPASYSSSGKEGAIRIIDFNDKGVFFISTDVPRYEKFCIYKDLWSLKREISRMDIDLQYKTTDKKSREIVYKNIPINFSNYTLPDYTAQLRERLNLRGLTNQQIWDYSFNNFQDIVKAIDIINSRHITICTQILATPSRKFTDLNDAYRQRIRQAAHKWINSINWEVRFCGYRLGLWTGESEFLDLSIRQLNTKIPLIGNPEMNKYYTNKILELTSDIKLYKGEIVAEQWQRIKQTILDSNIPRFTPRIISSLYSSHNATPEFYKLCYDLTQDDRAYIWWEGMHFIITGYKEKLSDFENLPEKIKLHAALAGYSNADFETSTKAKEALPILFTPELYIMNDIAWSDFRERLISKYDRKFATKVLIDFLKGFVNLPMINSLAGYRDTLYNYSFAASMVIQPINAWYGLNIGGIGTNENISPQIKTDNELKAFIDEAIKWYDENQKAEIIDLSAFKGRIVDTNSRPISDANITLIWDPGVQVEGDNTIIEGRMGKKYKTDNDGNFIIRKMPDRTSFWLNVEADGFIPRKYLLIQKQLDGSFQLSLDKVSTNIITIQRPGKISGRAIDANNNPMRNIQLEFFTFGSYSSGGTRMITTDENGFFEIDNVSAGNHKISYCIKHSVSYTQIFNGQESKQQWDEYLGPAGLLLLETKEGQEIKDVVLDLSNSTSTLELEVVDSNSNPYEAVRVTIWIHLRSQREISSGILCYFGLTSPNGIYKINKLPAGKFSVSVNPRNFPGSWVLDLDLLENETTRRKVQFK